jgi:hypothetical protein
VNVRELIEILKGYDEETEVELAIVAPVGDGDDEIAVDRYPVDGVLPWDGEDADEDGEDAPGPSLWLVGGEEDDVEAFMDALEDDDDEDDED